MPVEMRKLLVIDQDAVACRDMATHASTLYTVVRAADAKRGLEMLAVDDRIALVAVGQDLPPYGGIALLERIRDQKPAVRRMLLSGFGDLQAIVAGLHTGAIQTIVSKPLQPLELRCALQSELKSATAGAAV